METRAKKKRRTEDVQYLDQSLGRAAKAAKALHRVERSKDKLRAAKWHWQALDSLIGYDDPAVVSQLDDGNRMWSVAWTAGAHLPAISNPDGARMTWPQYRTARAMGTLPPRADPEELRYVWDQALADAVAPTVRDMQMKIEANYKEQDLHQRRVEPIMQRRIVDYASALSASGRLQGRQRRAVAKPKLRRRRRPGPRPRPKAKAKARAKANRKR